jgi:Raf kinase inhibitor-like YbhB/YbcL family protein
MQKKLIHHGYHSQIRGTLKMKKYVVVGMLLLAAAGLIFTKARGTQTMLTLKSDSFINNGEIPKKYTCHGEGISPELHWTSNLKDVGCYVLIVDDPDAQKVANKIFIHWIAFLPPQTSELPEGISSKNKSQLSQLAPGAHESRNDLGTTRYGGPCPPNGEHTYRFTLFALSDPIESVIETIAPDAPINADDFRMRMSDAIVGSALLVGKFGA